VIAARILAVLAALFFVLAFTLAIMLPPELPLGQAVAAIHHGGLAGFGDAVRKGVGGWVWMNVVVPMLLRPVWLLPVVLGLLMTGAAVTVSSRPGSARSHRRRS
jgi:hypothetical protein